MHIARLVYIMPPRDANVVANLGGAGTSAEGYVCKGGILGNGLKVSKLIAASYTLKGFMSPNFVGIA